VRVAIAVPAPHDARLAKEAARHGHDVVLRSAGDEPLEAAFAVARPEVAAVWSSPSALTSELLEHCDSRGIRVLAVIASDADRRHATELGVVEQVAMVATWPEVESRLSGHGRLAGFGSGVAQSPAVPLTPHPLPTLEGTPREPTAPATTPKRESQRSVSRAQAVSHAQFAPPGFSTTEPRRGVVIAVWGTAGAPGRTSVAIAVAAELAELGFSVALADVDTHAASIAPSLGLLDESPGFAAACRLAGADGLTIGELERIGQRYGGASANFWVLTGLGQPSRWPELSASRVSTTIALCRQWVDFTILDTGFSLDSDEEISSDIHAPRRNGATIAAVRDADHILAVGAADPVGLSRFLRSHGDLVQIATTSHITPVITKVRSSAIGLGPAGQITQTLYRFGGIDAPVLIPHDQNSMDAALLSGRTLPEVAPRSAVRLALRSLVQSRLVPEEALAGSRGAARSIFARRPRASALDRA
jgi:hypothetical protein